MYYVYPTSFFLDVDLLNWRNCKSLYNCVFIWSAGNFHSLIFVQPKTVGLLRQYPSTSCLRTQALHAALKARQQGIASLITQLWPDFCIPSLVKVSIGESAFHEHFLFLELGLKLKPLQSFWQLQNFLQFVRVSSLNWVSKISLKSFLVLPWHIAPRVTLKPSSWEMLQSACFFLIWQVPTNSNSPNTHSKSFPHWPLFSWSPMPHGSPSCWYDLIDRSEETPSVYNSKGTRNETKSFSFIVFSLLPPLISFRISLSNRLT